MDILSRVSGKVLGFVSVGALTLGGITTGWALSIAPTPDWSPPSITAQANFYFTGNSLIIDATSNEATMETTEYPFNRSMADLRIPKNESQSILGAYLAWGVSVPVSDSNSSNADELVLNLPDGSSHVVHSLSSYSEEDGQYSHHYYIADVSELNLETGIYSASVPALSDTRARAVAAGWALFVSAQNNDVPARTISYAWGDQLAENLSLGSKSIGFGLDPENDELTAIELLGDQSREPATGFTTLNDIVLGQDTNAGMTLRTLSDSSDQPNLALIASVDDVKQNSVSASIQLLDPATRTPIDSLRAGQKITFQVSVQNMGTQDIYNSEVSIALPEYIQYKRGSMNTLAGTINSGTLTDRDDDDPSFYDAHTRTIVWKPGDTAVSNTSRPHLIKSEDSVQLLEFEGYLGDYPLHHAVRLLGTFNADVSSRESLESITFGVSGPAFVQGLSSGPKTDLSVAANLTPWSATYWNLNIFVTNNSSISTEYEWSITLPEEVTHLDLEKSSYSCQLSDEMSRQLECRSDNRLDAYSTNLDSIVLRLNNLPEDDSWAEVKVLPSSSSTADINILDNTAAVTLRSQGFYQTPEANSEVFVSTQPVEFYSGTSILDNDTYSWRGVSIEIIEQPAHGRVKIESSGIISYQQITRAIIEQDSFAYALRDNVTGSLSKPATVTIVFPSKDEKG